MRNAGKAVAWERMHKAAAMVEECIEALGGQMTEWESRQGFVGCWMAAEVKVKGKVLPVAVSGGGVIQVNGRPHHPITRKMIDRRPKFVSAVAFYTSR